jgi:hypothetical protein
VQGLKKNQPDLYDKVRKGVITLRDTTKLTSPKKKSPADTVKHDFFRHLGHLLDGVFKGTIKERLDTLLKLKPSEMTPATAKSLKEITTVLNDMSKQANEYARKIETISKAKVA